jgi:hypothetical protein
VGTQLHGRLKTKVQPGGWIFLKRKEILAATDIVPANPPRKIWATKVQDGEVVAVGSEARGVDAERFVKIAREEIGYGQIPQGRNLGRPREETVRLLLDTIRPDEGSATPGK